MKLVLENGQEFHGLGFGAQKPVVGEIVFNTSMVGYQEIASDPAYAGQLVVMTYPLIGQYGITDDDFEARTFSIAGLIVREYCDTPSNFRYTKTLSEEMAEHGIPILSGPDTRMLTRIIRTHGSMKAAIVDEKMSTGNTLVLIAQAPVKTDQVAEVSCTKRWFSRTPQHKYDVVIVDCGLKHSIVSALNQRGCNVTVVPYNSTLEEILSFNPDGVIISNGPGSPDALPGLIELVNSLKGRLPLFGICLGHLLIARSYGAKTFKMLCGHHGGHPVRSMITGRIITTEHNHNYAVDEASLKGTPLEVVYKDASDGTVEGLQCPADKVYTVQFYPEGAPGPQESDFFDKFIAMMEE